MEERMWYTLSTKEIQMMHDRDMKEGQERWEKGNKLQVRKIEEHEIEHWRYINKAA